MSYVKMEGLEELLKNLDELPVKIEKNILRGTCRAAAVIYRDDAKSRCPVGVPSMVAAKYGAYPGALRDSIRTSSKSKNGVVNVNVIAGNYKAFYANMVEFGTKAHEEKPAGAKSLFVAGMFKMQINHPGAESKSFMRPAFDTKSGDAMQAAATYMTDRLDKELEKQG